MERSVYCLRHTAICMRIILSYGKVNIFNLAKNAGTSVEQIERFYAQVGAARAAYQQRVAGEHAIGHSEGIKSSV